MRYPKLQCLTAVPIFASDVKPTWLVLANTTDGRELGTEEANLLKSVGGVLSAHAQVVELFSEHEEMVLAFIRSLVTTLDAKDPYTRGHSERVRWSHSGSRRNCSYRIPRSNRFIRPVCCTTLERSVWMMLS